MQEYADMIFECLNKIEKNKGILTMALATELHTIQEKLKPRITIEEGFLFPAYSKYYKS